MKPCSKCYIVKPFSDFPYDSRRHYYQTICKECKYSMVNEWHADNKERTKEYSLKYPFSRIYIKTCRVTGNLFVTRVKNATTSKEGRKRVAKKFNNSIIERLVLRQHGLCKLCGNPFTEANKPGIDHVIPVCKGGSDDMDNLQAVHKKCNLIKGTKTDHNEISLLINARMYDGVPV